MKLYFKVGLIVCLIAVSNIARSADQPAPPPVTTATNGMGPKIQFATPVFDFGKVTSGTLVKHDFVFTNTGDATLEVTAVTPGCGCTTVGEWTRKVEPGKTGIIPIQFDSNGYNSPITKTPSLACNDKSQPNVTLQLRGTVFKPIDVTPPYVSLTVPPDSDGTGVTGTSHIVNNDDSHPLTLSAPESSWRAFTAELKTNIPGKDFDLIIKTVPPITNENPQGVISLHTSSSQMPNINVMAVIILQPPLEATPAQITLPAGALQSNTTYTVSILHQGAQPIELSQPTVNAAGVKAQIKQNEGQRTYTVTVTFPAGFEAPFGPAIVLSIKTDRPRFPVLYVPIAHAAPQFGTTAVSPATK